MEIWIFLEMQTVFLYVLWLLPSHIPEN
jgi:hypothetical protein